MKSFQGTIGAAALAMTVLSSPSYAVDIANSVNDFSGVQGERNWYYGYYSTTFAPPGFQMMQVFGPASFPNAWVVDYDLPSPQYWTSLWAEGGSPNGVTTSGGRTPAEQWAVRRWIAPQAGNFVISGNIADSNFLQGNGVIGHIFVNGAEIYSASVDNGNLTGVNYSLQVALPGGAVMDFAIDPKNSNDLSDGTRFTTVVSTVPEPDSGLLLSAGFGLLFILTSWRQAYLRCSCFKLDFGSRV